MKKLFISFLLLLFFSPLYLFANAGSTCLSAEPGGRRAIVVYSSGDTTATADTTETEEEEDPQYNGERPAGSLGEYEPEEEGSKKHFLISLNSGSHNHSNMRDDGITSATVLPALAIRLPFGFSIGYSGTINSGKYEGSSFDLGYTVSAGRGFVFNASYTAYQFTASSNQRKAQYNGTIDLNVLYIGKFWGFSLANSYAVGNTKDMSISTDIDYTLTLSPEEAEYDISLIPAITIAWGAQDPDLNSLLLKKQLKLTGNTNTKIKKPKFGILGYAFALPFDYSIGNFSITLGADYIIPVNVADSSTRKAYINLSGGVSFRFW